MPDKLYGSQAFFDSYAADGEGAGGDNEFARVLGNRLQARYGRTGLTGSGATRPGLGATSGGSAAGEGAGAVSTGTYARSSS